MADRSPPASLTLATFNTHMGVDGWSRPFDIVGACRSLDADVLMLQESWSPDDGGPSTADRVASALDYRVVREVALAHGRLFAPVPGAGDSWGPLGDHASRALHLDLERWKPPPAGRERSYVRGSWGIALLSRLVARHPVEIPLGQLGRDPARRVVLAATFDLEGGPLAFFGTHMSHITHGSHRQYRLLARRLPPATGGAVLVGDMNLWGPPVSAYVRGWRRAVTGRTWPAPRPHSQLDHILTTPPVAVTDARVSGELGSDHRAVVVTLALTGPDREGGPPSGPVEADPTNFGP